MKSSMQFGQARSNPASLAGKDATSPQHGHSKSVKSSSVITYKTVSALLQSHKRKLEWKIFERTRAQMKALPRFVGGARPEGVASNEPIFFHVLFRPK
jgi:hypothetical protein